MTLSLSLLSFLNPFLPKGFPINKKNCLALDRVQSRKVPIGKERVIFIGIISTIQCLQYLPREAPPSTFSRPRIDTEYVLSSKKCCWRIQSLVAKPMFIIFRCESKDFSIFWCKKKTNSKDIFLLFNDICLQWRWKRTTIYLQNYDFVRINYLLVPVTNVEKQWPRTEFIFQESFNKCSVV